MFELNLSDRHIKMRMQVGLARMFLGVTEQGGNNRGQMVARFQKAVDGRANGEPWCMAMAQYLAKETDKLFDFAAMRTSGDRHRLYPTEHVLTCWNKSPKEQRLGGAELGAWVIWAQTRHGKETGSGHVEIISKIITANKVKVIGGNTSGPWVRGVEREGHGVFEKTREFNVRNGSMKFKGLLSPWA